MSNIVTCEEMGRSLNDKGRNRVEVLSDTRRDSYEVATSRLIGVFVALPCKIV
jgi:hypothetical protein